ncbi:MAG: sigma-54-dependent Fis family transcriptional regulator [Gammaproteobacteria bacterium]|nr:sigma-54-dependent Fis family transcriptional regulator [Gammaproteobacteria bacterium]
MQNVQPMNIIWDNTAPIDAKIVSVLKTLGLSPRPVSIHSPEQDWCSLSGPVVLVISADSFASVDAALSFKRSLPIKVFMILRVNSNQLDMGIEAIRKGLDDVLCQGQDTEKRWEKIATNAGLSLVKNESYIFVDETSQHLLALVERVGASEVNALMNGPTGSGKEVLARLAHDFSPRRSGPFIPVNCAALPETLAESLLFGHAKGAFTGATKNSVGFFEQAEAGTLFLDEVGELPLPVQAKLLRALQEKEITPVGSPEPRSINTRILAATNRDLRQAIRIGSFREDLYFRLSTFRINVPSLRERTDDILPLANFFLMKYGDKRNELSVSPEALGKLLNYEWPGNVRELENVIQRAVVLSNGEAITAEHLFFDEPIHQYPAEPSFTNSMPMASEPNPNFNNSNSAPEFREFSSSDQLREGLQSAMDANEFRVISQTLKTARTRKEAASVLGISERTLRYKVAKMRERGIDIPRRRMGEM